VLHVEPSHLVFIDEGDRQVPVVDAGGLEGRGGRGADRGVALSLDLDLDRYDRCSRDA
jgi:hypothetical protein